MSHVLKIAHRGYSEIFPENTMESFSGAIKNGAHMIELDVHFTADNEVVVIHDDYIDRTSNGTGMIRDMTLDALRDFSYDNGIERYSGAEIPLLADVLDLSRGKCEVNIELKNLPVLYNGLEKAVIDIVENLSVKDQVILSSFDHYALQRCREIDASVRRGLLYDALWMAFKDEVNALEVYSVHPNVDVIYSPHLQWAKEQGIKVFPWVARNKRDMDRLLKEDFISGIMVNDLKLFNG